MKSLFYKLVLVMLIIGDAAFGQKAPLDSNAFSKWPLITDGGLSNDGRYVWYLVNNEPVGGTSAIVKSLNHSWQRAIPNGHHIVMDAHNHCIFQTSQDSLFVLHLEKNQLNYIAKTSEYRTSNGLLIYKPLGSDNLVCYELKTGKSKQFFHVKTYDLINSQQKLLVTRKQDSSTVFSTASLVDGSENLSYKMMGYLRYKFNPQSNSVAILSTKTLNSGIELIVTLWHLKSNVKQILVINAKDLKGLNYDSADLAFNQADFLFVSLKPPKNKRKSGNPVIWNSQDDKLPGQVSNPSPGKTIVINLKTGKINRLDNENYYYQNISSSRNYLVCSRKNTTKDTLSLLDLNNGMLTNVTSQSSFSASSNAISPDERYLVWYNRISHDYFSFDIQKHETNKMNAGCDNAFYDEDAVRKGKIEQEPLGINSWLGNKYVVYDPYDIWLVDPTCCDKPKSLTKGWGRLKRITFSPIIPDDLLAATLNKKLILTAFDLVTKQNGFWTVDIDKPELPKQLIMSNAVYFIPRINRMQLIDVDYPFGYQPVKSANGKRWLLQMMTSTHMPNLLVTNSFKDFTKLTNYNSNKNYNWLETELVQYHLPDGHISQGIIYKPENLDTTKKYPVIFNFYGERSSELNAFMYPDYSRAGIDIPSFVSDGYLVFQPDIYFKGPALNGKSLLQSINSAYSRLKKIKYVDTLKMGIQGHSFAGWETNYLVTHTQFFKAACEASGTSDHISAYNELNGDGNSRQQFYETSQQGAPYGKGVTPWTSPKMYMDNSPLFFVYDVTTPLLMMHGNKDGAVPFSQAIEFFNALKRSGKKAWLLEYKDEGHVLLNNINAKDFHTKMIQFFDHFLRDGAIPSWMQKSIELTNN